VRTDVALDGMLSGPDLAGLEETVRVFPGPVIASGGISTVDDIARCAEAEPPVPSWVAHVRGQLRPARRHAAVPPMSLAKRIIPCLDVDHGRVVKGVNFVNLRDAGDPAELAARYDAESADELVFLDITASSDAREILLDAVRRTADSVFIRSPWRRAARAR